MKPFATLLAAMALILLAAAPCLAQEGRVPTKITSQRMTYGMDANTVVFSGDVHASRPDMEIWADSLTAHLASAGGEGGAKTSDPTAAPKNLTIRSIEAVGSVRMAAEGREGSCQKAVYDMESGVLTMTGDPVISQGKNSIRGEVIKFNVKKSTSEILGGSGKVEAIFFTDEADLPK